MNIITVLTCSMVFYEYSTGEVLIINNGMNKWTDYKHVENTSVNLK